MKKFINKIIPKMDKFKTAVTTLAEIATSDMNGEISLEILHDMMIQSTSQYICIEYKKDSCQEVSSKLKIFSNEEELYQYVINLIVSFDVIMKLYFEMIGDDVNGTLIISLSRTCTEYYGYEITIKNITNDMYNQLIIRMRENKNKRGASCKWIVDDEIL